MKGRQHAASLSALLGGTHEGSQALLSPGVGWFVPAVRRGDVIAPGMLLGQLDTLGDQVALLAPAGLVGRISAVAQAGGRFAVDFKRELFAVAPLGDLTGDQATAHISARSGGLEFCAPSSGRFYGRPSPDKPNFVNVGDVVTAGQTLCLLEVMKTFHRVTYGGPTLPARARITAVLVGEELDVGSGDALFALEDASASP
ncbi:MAG: hypothetical protein IPL79_10100 [Myxococcales bacterium]|nr:hypothetical protein [Myxococcales bacterium]